MRLSKLLEDGLKVTIGDAPSDFWDEAFMAIVAVTLFIDSTR
jgi:hypothetical protein